MDTTQKDWILNIKMQCTPFVCVSNRVYQRTTPSISSVLLNPCHQNPHIDLWNMIGLQLKVRVSKIMIHIPFVLITTFMEYIVTSMKYLL